MKLTSEHLSKSGFAHGFSTRRGGLSTGPFRSLNLGRAIGDDESHVAENHRRLADALGYTRVFELSQVHSATVREVRAAEDPTVVRAEKGDALITRDAGVAIGVRTADCIPLLMAHPPSGAVAAVHAGWRGVETGIAAEAVRALGVSSAELIAVAGPHIRKASFEVGPEVAERLAAASSAKGVVDWDGHARPHVDLFRILEAQLSDLGVQLRDLAGDTFADPERFFSYRRDGKATGRHLSVIVAKGRS